MSLRSSLRFVVTVRHMSRNAARRPPANASALLMQQIAHSNAISHIDADSRRAQSELVMTHLLQATHASAPVISLESRLLATEFTLNALLAAFETDEATALFERTVVLLRGLRSVLIDSFLIHWYITLSALPALNIDAPPSAAVLPSALVWSAENANRMRAADTILDRYLNSSARSLPAAVDFAAVATRAMNAFAQIKAPESVLLLALRAVEWFTKCSHVSDGLDRQRDALVAHARQALQEHPNLLAVLDDTADSQKRRWREVVERDRLYRSLATNNNNNNNSNGSSDDKSSSDEMSGGGNRKLFARRRKR
jgi:hypothetical protein